MRKNILVLIPVEEEHKSYLSNCFPTGNFIYKSHSEATPGDVSSSEIIIGNIPYGLLKFADNLKWLQLESAGTGEYIKQDVLPENVILTNSSGAYGLAISEYMLGTTLMLFKNLHLYRDNQKFSKWEYRGNVNSLSGSIVLILGMGDIGSEYAKRVKLLGAYTIGIKRTKSLKPDYADELYTMGELKNVLPRADVLALSLPETHKTIKIINKDTLSIMKNNSIIINVGRGSAIDTEALCDAIEKQDIFGAALDVTDPEPLPPDHRLWKMENVIITPHVSGGYSLNHTHQSIVRIAGDNLKLYFKREKLKNIVSLTEGY